MVITQSIVYSSHLTETFRSKEGTVSYVHNLWLCLYPGLEYQARPWSSTTYRWIIYQHHIKRMRVEYQYTCLSIISKGIINVVELIIQSSQCVFISAQKKGWIPLLYSIPIHHHQLSFVCVLLCLQPASYVHNLWLSLNHTWLRPLGRRKEKNSQA